MDRKIEEQVINLYINNKLSCKKISKIVNINEKTIFAILKRSDIKTRTLSEACMKYTCNDEFFSSIDSEEKAYWLGALFADGNISKKASKSGQVFFSSKDKEWVDAFLRSINSSNTSRSEYHKVFNSTIWKAQITSSRMYNSLEMLGCVPNKSLVIRVPQIDNSLMHHFIRGYFDGDGSVSITKNLKEHDWKILKSSICSGSYKFLEDILNFLPSSKKKLYKTAKIYYVQFSLFDSIRLYNYIYNGANIYLVRKRNIFEDYLNNYKPRKKFRDYNKQSKMD